MTRSLFLLISFFLIFTPLAQARDKFLDIQTITSPNGLSAWLVENHALPIIAMEFGWKNAGATNDPPGKQGLVRLLSNTLDEGAGPYDSQRFQAALLDNAISLSFSMGRDDFTGSLKTQTSDKTKAFELLRLSVTQPRFDTAPVKRMIDGNLSQIRSDMTDPDWISARLMNDRAFAGHTYAANIGGTLSSLPPMTADDLRRVHKRLLARDNLRIGVVGDITAAELAPLLDQIFGGLPPTADPRPVENLTIQNQGKTFLYPYDIPQTIVSIMMPGIRHTDPDYAAGMIANQIFGGGGFGSRLMDIIRERAGLTYGIYSGLSELDHTTMLNINTSTKNETVPLMIKMIKEEMSRAASSGFTESELQAARGYLLGSMPSILTSTDKIAGILLSLQLDNRPLDSIDTYRKDLAKVTLVDVKRVAARLLKPETMITVLVGQPETPPAATIRQSTLPNVE